MAITNYTLIQYDGIDLGTVYLEDVGKRSQLGGGIQHKLGQDIVLNPGDVIGLVNTGDVLLSKENGVLAEFGPTGAGGQGGINYTELDSITGLTGTQAITRSGIPTTKTDPTSTLGDF